MASVRQIPGTGSWELTLRNKKLLGPGKRVYLTFESESLAVSYGEECERRFKLGIIPDGLLEKKIDPAQRLHTILREWMDTGAPAPSDMEVLALLVKEVGHVQVSEFNYAWCEKWVQHMKLEQNLSPSTIRKRVGSLSRTIDWKLRKVPDMLPSNPLKILPRGASTYTVQDQKLVKAAGKVVKADQERDRRQEAGEHEAIMRALAGEKRKDRERPMELKYGHALTVLYNVIIDTGMRLREAYRLKRGQVDLKMRLFNVSTSKQRHGQVKFRVVPIKPSIYPLVWDYLEAMPDLEPDDPIFPWWVSDDPKDLRNTTNVLTQQFLRLFDYAGVEGMTEHDLRHEATCRWYELRRPDGQWVFREAEIYKIMGWAPGSPMGKRYASFRAEDLAARMWTVEEGQE